MLTKDYLAPQSVPLLGRFIVCPPFVPTTAAVPNKTTPCVYGFACTLQLSKTKVLEWLKNGDMGGFVHDGKPIYPEYIDHVHCSQEVLEPIPESRPTSARMFGLR